MQIHSQRTRRTPALTLRLLMSYIYGAPSKARNANVVYIYGPTFGNAETVSFLKPFYYQLMHIMLKNTELLKHSKITLQHVSVYVGTIFRELQSVLG